MISTVTKSITPCYSFAYGSDYVSPVVSVSDESRMNFVDGMISRSEYEEVEDPQTHEMVTVNTGKKVLIGDFNLLGKIGCNAGLLRQMGGIRTFNQSFSELIGGYPKGARLDHLYYENEKYYLRKVVSLIENNTHSFLTDADSNGVDTTSAGVDDVYWSYCDTFNPVITPKSSFNGVVNILHCIMDYNKKKDWSQSATVTLTKDCAIWCFAPQFLDIGANYDMGPVGAYVKVNNKNFYLRGSYGELTSNNGKIVKSGSVVSAYMYTSQRKHCSFSVVGIPVTSSIGSL